MKLHEFVNSINLSLRTGARPKAPITPYFLLLLEKLKSLGIILYVVNSGSVLYFMPNSNVFGLKFFPKLTSGAYCTCKDLQRVYANRLLLLEASGHGFLTNNEAVYLGVGGRVLFEICL